MHRHSAPATTRLTGGRSWDGTVGAGWDPLESSQPPTADLASMDLASGYLQISWPSHTLTHGSEQERADEPPVPTRARARLKGC